MKKNTFLLMAGMLMFSSVAYASTKEYKFVQKESNGTVKSSKTVTLGTGEGYSEDAYMKWNNKLSGRGSCAGDGLKASNTTITCTCKSGYKWNSGLTDCVQGTPSQSTGSTSTSSTTTASVSSANFNYTLIKRDAYSIELKSTESSTRATLKDETDALNKKFKDYAWCAGNSSQYGYQIQCEMSNKQSFWNKDRCKNFISDLNGKGDVTSSCSKVVSGKDYYKFECVSPYTFDSTNKECQATFTIRYVDNVASDPQSLKLNVHPLDTPSDQCPGGQ